MPVAQALDIARRRNLDLVEVATTTVPPVCRLLDYGKYRYEQTKKEREMKKSQRVALLREVRMRPRIDDHDFESKVKLTKKLLDEGDKVKVTVMFRGREIVHPELGMRLIQRLAEALKGGMVIEKQPLLDGKRLIMVLAPVSVVKKVKEEVKSEDAKAENA